MGICKIDGCGKKHSAKGLCNVHYQRMITGVPVDGHPKKSTIEKIMDKVKKAENGCWIWCGAKSGGDGRDEYKYGYIRLNGKALRVHRVLYEINNGKIPDGKIALHKCDIPLCVNPEHIEIGTHLDNSKDAIKKGRMWHPKGEDNHSKLSESDVFEIRKNETDIYAEMGRKYRVNASTIKNIKDRKKWKHI